MPDILDTFQAAATQPRIDTVLASIQQSLLVFTRLSEDFPHNESFQRKRAVLEAVEQRLQHIAATPDMSEDAFAHEMRDIEKLFKSAGARKVDLSEWGLLL